MLGKSEGKIFPVQTLKAYGGTEKQLHTFFVPSLGGGR
jgi:hypothetical protein